MTVTILTDTVADGYIDQTAPDTNHGDATISITGVLVGPLELRVVVRFDLDPFIFPPGTDVASAVLTLNVTIPAANQAATVYRLPGPPITNLGVTWNTHPNIDPALSVPAPLPSVTGIIAFEVNHMVMDAINNRNGVFQAVWKLDSLLVTSILMGIQTRNVNPVISDPQLAVSHTLPVNNTGGGFGGGGGGPMPHPSPDMGNSRFMRRPKGFLSKSGRKRPQ